MKSSNRTSVLTSDSSMHSCRKLRLAYVVTHPIQYQAPLLRRLALEPDIDLTVLFASDHSVRGYRDEGFGGARVKWDIPLLQGYRYEFLPTIRAATWTGFWAPINRGFYAAFRRGKYDVIWLHGYWSINSIFATISVPSVRSRRGMPSNFAAIEKNMRLIANRRRERRRSSIACHFIDGVLPVGTRNRDYWLHYLGPQFPSFMAPYAVDNAYFEEMAARASHSREEFRQTLGLEKGRAIILYASKLIERKRCVDLINAYLGIRTEAGGKRPYLLIVGDGPERAKCDAMVREAGDSSTRFLGFQNQSQMAKLFDLCDVFVLPSVDEPFGLIVNEVMNAGRAIIVSDQVGCQPDLIEDGVNGKVFPAGDVLALRSAIESLIGDSTLRNVLGRSGLDRIKLWSFEDDIRGLREALHYVAGLPLGIETHDQVAADVSA